MAYLVLVRHGTSEYNEKGWWTGWDDPPLIAKGEEQAKNAGKSLSDIHFDYAYTSVLLRAKQTLTLLLKEQGQQNLIPIENKALNERNYGDFTRKNKWDVKKEIGEEEFQKLRRGWDYPIPNGESLKQVYEREIPYFEAEILPKLKEGKNVLIVSSGNAHRAIVKYIEHIPESDIATVEIGLGEAHVYTINEKGEVVSKEIRAKNELAGKV